MISRKDNALFVTVAIQLYVWCCLVLVILFFGDILIKYHHYIENTFIVQVNILKINPFVNFEILVMVLISKYFCFCYEPYYLCI